MRCRISFMFYIAALLACALPTPPPPPSAGESDLQTRVAGTLMALTPRPSLTPNAGTPPSGLIVTAPPITSVPGILPRPIYFIANRIGSDQVWRVETDAKTLTQITKEEKPVTDFDVSPSDGTLAYVADNQLILADRSGGKRHVLIAGPALPPTPDNSYWSQQVSNPAWSPDGTRLAYAYNGIGVVTPSTGAIAVLIANVIPPADKLGDIRLYRPSLWSPDGTKLLAEVSFYELGSLVILPAGGGSPLNTSIPEGPVCCQPVWGNDNSAIFLANDSVGLITSGLWKIDAKTGAGATLIQGSAGGAFTFVGWPKQAPDGRLLYFFSQSAAMPQNGYWPTAMYISAADGVTGRTQLRTDSYIVGEALWSPDAATAVIGDISALAGSAPFPWNGPLRLLKTDNSPAITLADSGRNLRWGK